MNKAALLPLAALLALPSAASGATADADVRNRGGAPFGPVTFKAAKGESNRVTITSANGRLRFHDSANRVKARGDCDQVDRRTAICPFTEDIAQVRLGNGADRATIENLVEVFGGSGNDLLRGSRGTDWLSGDSGNDELHGGRGNDRLTGGTGGDRLFGGSGDDDLIDGETDAQATPDLFRGGSSRDSIGADRGDTIDYSNRRRALDIDLSRGRVNFGRERDVIRGLESVKGGSGNDRLAGDGDDNWLEGNGGNDRLRGRGGEDIPQGGNGEDSVSGDDGNDVVWGDRGTDALSGGAGDDLLIGADSNAEALSCGSGDDDARNTRLDTLRGCELSTTGSLYVKVQPEVEGETARFQVACQRLGGCSGTITLSSLDGDDYGRGDFAGLPDDPQTFSTVAVQLTPAGAAALQQGAAAVQVAYGTVGGYRAFLGA